ncbi:uncharacterized protein Z518_04411 [Rhinocladiella mackenziei CBS 650.93]|uniref:Rhinocladiella mackenziei CBS 650.93 unplaced genomic scaffold supercont1.3, whole genome shotgun sequence n=1 Tax=Rhinocladiella mackenziei CBS 650.93 TaxID=1442369 RepID=A0A0D2JBG0_9EURO|nr:uncharacterized protein Z518_04411 [Rhinocladiella mackenziei CBS 650.93]KIX06435.1 hypothetical protein Z518_04411 [Rhinocladiella mackenziei CBS 650.93]
MDSSSSSSLKDKLVFITGAGSGIGRATAIKLSSLGAILYLTDISIEGLGATLLCCTPHDRHKHRTRCIDVSSDLDCELAIAEATVGFGRIDHVFNCAGINPTAYPLTETPVGYFERLLSVNVMGVYNITRLAIPHLPQHAGSSIVNVASISGLKPSKNVATYCATKYAVVGFSKSMALELGEKGVRVNVVAPGYIYTPTNGSVRRGEDAVKRAEKDVSMGRFGTAEEVADVVAFLMSEGARYMNGSVVQIDGGK